MQKLKKLVRQPQSPCSQVVRRLSERVSVQMQRVQSLGVRREHTNGPPPPLFHGAKQYTQYKTELFTFKLDKANSHVFIWGRVAKIRNIFAEKGEVHLVYSIFSQQESLIPHTFLYIWNILSKWPLGYATD